MMHTCIYIYINVRARKGLRGCIQKKTLISLTLSVYDWAHYTTTKGAVKMHTQLDYIGIK